MHNDSQETLNPVDIAIAAKNNQVSKTSPESSISELPTEGHKKRKRKPLSDSKNERTKDKTVLYGFQ